MTEKTKFHFSRKDTSDIMGISSIALGQWKVGWDFKKGNATFYDIREVVKHRLARDEGSPQNTLTSERTRLARAQADNQELDLKVKRGELVPVSVIGEHWQTMTMAMRSKLLAMPAKIAIAAIDASTIKDIEDTVTELLYQALEEINDDGIPEETKRAAAGDKVANASTTKLDSKSVGGQVQKTKPRSKRGTRSVANK